MAFQRTIKNNAKIEGMGIHTGKEIKVVFKPAPADSGIKFQRIDMPGKPIIPASIESLIDKEKKTRRTSIGNNGAEIHTIEHLLATLSGLEIDNILVEINGPELPGLDGSAEKFLKILKESGIKEQDKPQKAFQVREPIWVEDNGSTLAIFPDVNFKISYTLDYPTTNFRTQYGSFLINQDVYGKEIAPSRTFCLEEEVERLKSLGFGKGASLENTVVVGKKGIVSGKLRFEDEFLRHKVLDIIGDLYLIGYPVKGHVIGIKSGHFLNLKLLEKIHAQARKYSEKKVQQDAKSDTGSGKSVLDSEDIKKIIPHRYPFLMVDRIVELGEKTAVGIKKLSMSNYFFAGHFPGNPIMPGVLMLEALAQVGGVLLLKRPENTGKTAYFMSINNAKFRRIVKPGDELRLEIEVTRYKTRTGQIHGQALVDGQVVCEADLLFAFDKR